MTQDTLTIIRPDDWHVHLREGQSMADVLPYMSSVFARAGVMPNLKPPVTTVAHALAYRSEIMTELDRRNIRFNPLMFLYLTDNTDPEEIRLAGNSPHILGVKYYPAGATTNSASGVTDIARVYDVLSVMEEVGLPLSVHGEVTDPSVDIFDREAVFIDRILGPLFDLFPALRVVLEHITTQAAVDFVREAGPNVAATITAHHLLYNRNAMFQGGICPHHYCLPVLKRERHREALLGAIASPHPRFFLGTDSAPHPKAAKESACGCAGMFTAHAAMGLYAEAFEEAGALDRLEHFASFNGPNFYGLPRNTDTITLSREPWMVPVAFPFGSSYVIPLRAGETVGWKVVAGPRK